MIANNCQLFSLQYNTSRDVRRRPAVFQAFPDLAGGKPADFAGPPVESQYPPFWTETKLMAKKQYPAFKLLPVTSNSTEWKMLEQTVAKFFQTGKLSKAERIQNPCAWNQFLTSEHDMMIRYKKTKAVGLNF